MASVFFFATASKSVNYGRRTTMKTLTSIVASVMLLLFCSHHSDAQTYERFGIEPEKKLAKKFEKLADTCFKCGDTAKEYALYTYARSWFNYGLMFDPDHRKIRKTMGYKKKRGKWVLEEDMVPLEDQVREDRKGELIAKLWAETKPDREAAVKDLWEFVKDTKLERDQRLLALWWVLKFDPDHAFALRAARATKGDNDFLSDLDEDARALRIKWIADGQEPEVISEQTTYEKDSGISMSKTRTDFAIFHVKTKSKSDEWAKALNQFCDASRAHALKQLGYERGKAPAKDANRLHYTVLGDRDEFKQFVYKCSGIKDAAQRKEVAEHSGGTPTYAPYGAVWYYPSQDNDYGLRDGIAHDVASKEIFRLTGPNAYWLSRGVGYMNSVHMNDSTQAKFFGVKTTGVIDTGGAEALPGLGNSAAGWRLRVAMDVAGGQSLKLSELFSLRVAAFTSREMASAFCMTEYLMTKHKEGLKKFLDAAFEDRKARYKEKKASASGNELREMLYEALGKQESELMDDFGKWVTENYTKLPTDE